MKKSNRNLYWLIAGTIVLAGLLGSCKKSTSGHSGPKPPNNPGGYDSANQIQPNALVAYWPFNGSPTDVKQGLTGSLTNASYTTGVKGQAYKGGGDSYLQITSTGTLGSLTSYTLSVWFEEPAEPINDTTANYIAGQGAQGLFFMYDTVQAWNLLHLDFEPYKPVSGDSVVVHAGFNSTGAVAYQGIVPAGWLDSGLNKWEQVVVTYDGGSSKYTLYQNGVAIGAETAWSSGQFAATPASIWTDGSATTPFGNIKYKNPPLGIIIGAFPQAVQPTISNSIGGPQPWSGNFQGALDEIRVYNAALNASDVASLYILEKAGF
jgi:hypothetical protein